MIRDEELHNSLDYSEGQKEAAHRILVELVNLFDDYKGVWADFCKNCTLRSLYPFETYNLFTNG